MPVMSFSVPRRPSRQTMKAIRKAAAQNERQNTTVQLSRRVDEAGDRAAKAPEDRRQGDEHEADALVARRNGVDVAPARCCRSVASLMMRMAANQSPPEMLPTINPSALFNATPSGVVQPRNPVVAIMQALG